MKTLAIYSIKGGVGKTTTAVNLGAYLSTFGIKVLIVDGEDPVHLVAGVGESAQAADRAAMRASLGLDRPLAGNPGQVERYLRHRRHHRDRVGQNEGRAFPGNPFFS